MDRPLRLISSNPLDQLARTLEALLVVASQPLSVEELTEAANDDSERVETALGLLRERFFRLGPAALTPRPEPRIAPQDPQALASALRALAAEPPAVSLAHMELRFPPVTQFLERFRSVLRRRRRFDFDAEVEGMSRVEQAVAFLALLELRRSGDIALSQAAPFAPIRVFLADERRELWTARSA